MKSLAVEATVYGDMFTLTVSWAVTEVSANQTTFREHLSKAV